MKPQVTFTIIPVCKFFVVKIVLNLVFSFTKTSLEFYYLLLYSLFFVVIIALEIKVVFNRISSGTTYLFHELDSLTWHLIENVYELVGVMNFVVSNLDHMYK